MTTKRKSNTEINTKTPKTTKKQKVLLEKPQHTKSKPQTTKTQKVNFEKQSKFKKTNAKKQPPGAKGKAPELSQKPEDWNEFKKKKKELRLKRRQNKPGFDVIVRAKQIGEKFRQKILKGGEIERNKLVNELHSLLKGKGHYAKFVLGHDTSRIVQWLLKYSSQIVKKQVSQELIPVTLDMLQSKYGIFCVKRLLKYGDQATKTSIVDKMYSHVVRLSSHVISAPVIEYAYTTCASPRQKQHLVQEFYSDIYKKSKDDQVKRLRDTFAQTPSLKTAILGATKANLIKVINKKLLDSTLVQTVLHQFLLECSVEDRADLIPQLVPHIVVISNSKDGARAAMQCLWHGTNKDRKLAMKTIKEHAVEMSKHEHAHCTIIALFDAIDDTVLLHKVILSEMLKVVRDLAEDEWGRKVLLWLVAPADPTYFHPVFVKELEQGRTESSSKKDADVRRKEILGYSVDVLVNLVGEDPRFWLKNSSLAYEMVTIMKVGKGDGLKTAFDNMVQVIVDPDWKIKIKEDKEILGIEEAGMHMVLKKLAKTDEKREEDEASFGASLVKALDHEILNSWLVLNRACFVLVAVYENGTKEVKESIKTIVKEHKNLLKSQQTAGSQILLQKLEE